MEERVRIERGVQDVFNTFQVELEKGEKGCCVRRNSTRACDSARGIADAFTAGGLDRGRFRGLNMGWSETFFFFRGCTLKKDVSRVFVFLI